MPDAQAKGRRATARRTAAGACACRPGRPLATPARHPVAAFSGDASSGSGIRRCCPLCQSASGPGAQRPSLQFGARRRPRLPCPLQASVPCSCRLQLF
ncbi:hypothetical protein PVAP13_2KG394805 [Panicum virgatum]|uniref:Uncharacterized protein n=1 Tax=Panicum virgatum TaxID=38727 RepID=A0A8T0WPK8_PANVG|nr:hypothetical protein PVAP13_2KG394805 [Panicum virgatum]